MNKCDIAWFAGFFEGEGCVRLGSITNAGNGRAYGSPVLDICQVNREPLDKCKRLFSDSRIYGPYQYTNNRQPHFKFTVLGRSNVENIYSLIKEFLSTKRKGQFEKAFNDHDRILNRPALKKGPRTNRMTLPPSCHPDRKCVSLGLCNQCYRKELRMRKNAQ